MANIEQINYIKAPAAKIYEVLTTSAGLAAVWTEKLIVEPTLGFVCAFDFDDDYSTRMKILELQPAERILWECVSEQDPEWRGTHISFDISERKNATAVVLKQMYWKEVTEYYQSCNYNWGMFLYSLKSFCEEGKGMPFQTRKF